MKFTQSEVQTVFIIYYDNVLRVLDPLDEMSCMLAPSLHNWNMWHLHYFTVRFLLLLLLVLRVK